MPERIQSVPRGLLSFLGINGPRNPDVLLDEVRAIVDVTPRFNAPLLTVVSGTSTVVAAKDGSVPLTVPNGEAWDVVAANFTALAAGAAVVPALELNVGGCAVAFIPGTDTVRANPYEQTVCWIPQGGTILSAGFAITGFVRSTPNSNLTCITRALVRVTKV